MVSRVDPTLIQLYEATKSPELQTAFLKANNLLPHPPALGYIRTGTSYIARCADKPFNPAKPNCTGVITEVLKDGLAKLRYTVCKSQRSAHIGSSAYDPTANAGDFGFFNSRDELDRPNRKIDIQSVLYIAFCVAKDLPPSRLEGLVGIKLSSSTLVKWSTYIREMTVKELNNFPKMGGVGDIIEIDECYLKGRRKGNRGRLMTGNVAGHRGHSRNNYLRRSQGPWLFGMICRRTKEVRMFWVQDRSAATLIPLVFNNVAQGSIIYSDEWRAYNCLPRFGFHHENVNHSQNFVDPLPMLKQGPGVALSTIESHLAKFWWLSLNGRHVCGVPFFRLAELIAKHNPQ